jgi:hypothetical protein
VPGVPWPATDGLGRELPLAAEVGPPRGGRFVGMFYFLWHVGYCPRSELLQGPYDVSKILARDPEALRKTNSPLWGPVGSYHYWAEPLYGYYLSSDRWVLRRHAQLLADAGVDTLIFDATNAETYPDSWRALGEVCTELRQAGERTPQFAFMVNTAAGQTAARLYRDLYAPGHFKDLWFVWQGKPLLICDPAEASSEWRDFFTLRRAHWPFTMTNTPQAWHWEATYPQPYGFNDDPKQPEQVNVSVAQNLDWERKHPVNMSQGRGRGRGFHNRRQDASRGAIERGANFQEQWSRALELQPPFVMITSWNEWIAGRWHDKKIGYFFVDQFDPEFSRDTEPMRGGFGDHFLWQTIAHVRRYKGVPPLPRASAAKTIRIPGDSDQWQSVEPEFRDHTGEVWPRRAAGSGGLTYTNTTGRNDLLAFKVARDQDTLFFQARAVAPLTPATGANGMWLWLDTDSNAATGWHGYDYLVGRVSDAPDRCWLERHTGGWQWEKVRELPREVKGNTLHLAIARAALGLPPGTATRLDFKWTDNLTQPGDLMDFYLSGDVAPEGRFNFRFEAD